jgi:hypothetical protein
MTVNNDGANSGKPYLVHSICISYSIPKKHKDVKTLKQIFYLTRGDTKQRVCRAVRRRDSVSL